MNKNGNISQYPLLTTLILLKKLENSILFKNYRRELNPDENFAFNNLLTSTNIGRKFITKFKAIWKLAFLLRSLEGVKCRVLFRKRIHTLAMHQ